MSHKTTKYKKPIVKNKNQQSIGQSSHTKDVSKKKSTQAFSLEQYPFVFIILLFVAVSIIYFPIAFQKQSPPASDTIQWQGAAQRIIEYNKTHSDRALWQPNMFSGMPTYLISFPNRFPFVENITKVVDYIMNWRIFLLFIGGLGIFLLLRYLGLDPFSSFFGAVAFMFSCHWTGLLDIGHNTKYTAIMWIPWVLWGIMYLRKHPGCLGIGMTSVFLIAQLRENHPQISYYMYLFIAMYWLYNLIETIQQKDWGKFFRYTIWLIVSFIIMVLAVMNPFLSTWEYGHYTIRGGNSGLDKAYAQGWSFHPWEIITLIIPDFFGGINRNYWGWMEFTQIYNYMGILVLALGVFALVGRRKKLGWFLWISSLLFLIMSFGRHWNFVSDLLLKYLPYFNKFRVPSMILTMVQVNFAILAALGLSAIVEKVKEDDKAFIKRVQTSLIIISFIFIVFLVMGKGFFRGLPFTTTSEIAMLKQNNAFDQLNAIKEMRLNLLYKSGAFSLLFLTIGLSLILLYLKRHIAKTIFLLFILVVTFIDLWIYTGKSLQDLRPRKFATDYFAKRDYDDFLLSDSTTYRIYPLNVGMAGKWAYYHQTIQGYHGAKLQRYQDILENCLDAQLRQNKINFNLLNMLNVKYVVFQDTLPFFQTRPVFSSEVDDVVIHRNLFSLPRAWFVDSLKIVSQPKEIWETINSEEFNPALTAIVEEGIGGVQTPLMRQAELINHEMHKINFELETDKPGFLVVSEVYYPAGWKAYLDGKETRIYPTNYILRGVVVPEGKHILEMRFEPQSYKLSIALSVIGLSVSLLFLLIGIYLSYKRQSKKLTST